MRILSVLLAAVVFLSLISGCNVNVNIEEAPASEEAGVLAMPSSKGVTLEGTYTSPEDVSLYIHTYKHLPQNYITKSEARDLGWDSGKGNLFDVAPGKSIGGDVYKNYEGALPDASGRVWNECDVNYTGGYRGAERILYSTDGLIFYTADHYNTFAQLY